MAGNKIRPLLALTLTDTGLIGGYFFAAVLGRWGDPDQSLLFWSLPLLFIGLACLGPGLVAGIWSVRQLRKPSADR